MWFSDGGKRKCDDSAVDEERAAKNPRSSSPEPSADVKDINAQDMLVLGLEWSVTDAELKKYFEQFGEVASAEVGAPFRGRFLLSCVNKIRGFFLWYRTVVQWVFDYKTTRL